ncbi:uncharacterized protein I206_100431 [Kwoniella pini CBS 10737]|uniref:Uncharacterized protein n=1 Tax=Kwoniella pini CBS 10737 TaxID=1296096 RepID=A0A1B9IDU5_9TREE|nr:uncharacterized protein I206_00896 [Kwoniella pini CBS 10737]OCF53591.1 hypothetical protein I206_00896 [Kwoniella pini CBS 10737]
MTVPSTAQVHNLKGRPHTLIREASFYQEAYLASSSYIRAIGNQLKKDWGFRQIEKSDVSKYQPFLSNNEDDLLLDLICTTAPQHIIQLPINLINLKITPKCQMDSLALSSFSTILTSCYVKITDETIIVNPLKDLISFLQCLLPSSNALSLSPPTKTISTFGRCLGTSEKYSKTRLELEQEEEEKIRNNSIDSWRFEISPSENENEIENKNINTPCTSWLNKNEEMLRDTVGCGYYRRLREVAEDQKNTQVEVDIVEIGEVATG